MKQQTLPHRVALVEFSCFRCELEAACPPWTVVGALERTGMQAAVFTIVQELALMLLQSGEERSPSDWRYHPSFWDDTSCTRKALDVLTSGLADPVVWALGEYIPRQMLCLKMTGQVDADVPTGSVRGRVSPVPLILRSYGTEIPALPDEQGFGHWPGARLVCFERTEEPQDLYDIWLSNAKAGNANRLAHVLVADHTDTVIPQGAAALLAPFGCESREHALMAARGLQSEAIGPALASALGVPFFVCDAPEEQFWTWEAEYVLPADIEERVQKAAGPLP